ncbi:P27 family phage terminase small subunit [Gemmata sp. G18]|uniref:P27 family phage terminase small subunit n=1 Tax=Gemmata palustris TaxID=2822762 RepID=A0ABS5BT42_9BACT|nr:P27 family phage terminase small subunit [Gemmata palustris]MBP3956897.1 P27 family phage terminase small subunit [Gemmata palustris]
MKGLTMRGGNNRIPPSEHLARGTYRANRHSKLPNDSITNPPLASDPPAELTDRGRAVWEDLYPIVTSLGIVTEAERHTFAMFCLYQGYHIEAAEHVKLEGMFKKPKRGESAEGVQYSRWYRLMNDSAVMSIKLASCLGLTPTDRHRVARVNRATEQLSEPHARPLTDLDRLLPFGPPKDGA